MKVLNNECAREAINFIYKYGDLTYGSAYDAIQLLTSNGFAIYRTDGDEQVVYTDPDGKVWHPHRGYWCWKVSSELAHAQKRIKELEAKPAPAARSDAVKAAWLIGRRSYAPAFVLEDDDRTEREWEKAKAELSALEPAAPQEAEPVAWMWEEVVDPSGDVIHGGTITRFATHWSTPPSYADVTPLYTRPTEQAVTEAAISEAQEMFADYFRRNYPGPDTIIGEPDWHSPKIFQAALHALRSVDALKAAMEAQK